MLGSRPYTEERAPRILVSAAAVGLVAIDVLYLGLVQSQGESPFPLVTRFMAAFFVAVAIALVGSLLLPRGVTLGIRGAAAGALAAATVMSAMSIGAAVLVPAVLCGAATAITVARAPGKRNVVIAIACIAGGAAGFLGGLQTAWSFYPNS